MKSDTQRIRDQHQREFVKIYDSLLGRHSRWQVWADFVTMAAISISNIVDHANAKRRSETYKTLQSQYSQKDQSSFAKMLGILVCGLEANPDQDFLGSIFMGLELGNEHNGQFFTPYNLCQLMVKLNTDPQAEIAKKGWISVNDPACGAGATLIAFANECMRQDVNYQERVLFVAQDIDYIVGMMCYIQLSLIGCPGYVVIANTLTNPVVSIDPNFLIPRPGENIWYTPLYFTSVWHYRRLWAKMDIHFRSSTTAPQTLAQASVPEPSATGEAFRERKHGQLSFF